MEWINLVGQLALLYFAVQLVAPDFRGGPVAEVTFVDKLIGALAGSGTTVAFSWGRDGWFRRSLRFWSGIFVAIFGTGATIELLGLQNSIEMNRFVASVLSFTGYAILQFLLSKELHAIVKQRLSR